MYKLPACDKFCSDYTMFHKKEPLFVFFIIHSNDDQFKQNFYQL